ncbi:MAG TPA: hypothetical protein VJM34_07900, partial [Novosphingobium sp.]|nr:hypothetical protein [Novosphingobium sp.]
YLPHEAVMKSIELLGTHVIPELKKRGAAKMAQGLQNTIKQTEKHVASKPHADDPLASLAST